MKRVEVGCVGRHQRISLQGVIASGGSGLVVGNAVWVGASREGGEPGIAGGVLEEVPRGRERQAVRHDNHAFGIGVHQGSMEQQDLDDELEYGGLAERLGD